MTHESGWCGASALSTCAKAGQAAREQQNHTIRKLALTPGCNPLECPATVPLRRSDNLTSRDAADQFAVGLEEIESGKLGALGPGDGLEDLIPRFAAK